LIANEEVGLAISALASALQRLEMRKCDCSQREAAVSLARAFNDIARKELCAGR
jgi:hypothetical protein